MDTLADAVGAVVPFAVGLLLVGRNGIVNHRPDALARKVFPQVVAFRCADGIDVPNVLQGVGTRRRKGDERVRDALAIGLCNAPTCLVVGIQSLQFEAQHGGLHLVHAAVEALHLVEILLLAAVVGHSANVVGQLLVVCRDAARVAQGAQVLSGIETDARRMTEMPGANAFIDCSVGLCHVLYDLQPMPFGHLHDGFHVADTAVEMHHHDGFCTLCYKRFDAFRVDEIVLEARFAEHRHQPCAADGKDAGDVGVGGDDDFGMVVPAEQPFVSRENHGQSVQSVARRHAVLRSAVLGKRFAETRVLLSKQVPPAADHARDLCRQLRLEAVCDALQVEVGD